MRINNNRLSNGRSRATVFAAAMVWILLAMVFPMGGGTVSSARRLTLGYEVYYYTDSTFAFQCGYYNSCTKVRTGCLTAYQERWGIACGER
jgi:ABC-type long-subunit fatty acid transport system fused permease/ATPase subunit